MKKIIFALGASALCIASIVEILSPATPQIFYNKSASAPVGWYKLDADAPIKRDALVAAFAPAEARNFGAMREYLPEHVPLIKTVWATGGEMVCSENGTVRAPNRPDIYASAQDGLGRNMPSWTGCKTLQANEVFLISTHVQTSWDSRYFGPVPMDNIIGVVRFIGDKDRPELWGTGWARGKGAEGKIKASSALWALTHCLHISFRGAMRFEGGATFSPEPLVIAGVCGGAMYPEDHATSRRLAW